MVSEIELAEARDKMLRAQAELENYRKRARASWTTNAVTPKSICSANCCRCSTTFIGQSTPPEKNADAVHCWKASEWCGQQLETLLEQHQCKPIEAIGQPFDPAHHEAVMQQTVPDKPENTVTGDIQTGYHLHDRVVRPAQVVVSKKE